MFHNVLTNDLIDELIEIALFEVKYFRCEMVPGYQSFNDMHQKYENVKSINDLVTISESLYRITFNKFTSSQFLEGTILITSGSLFKFL